MNSVLLFVFLGWAKEKRLTTLTLQSGLGSQRLSSFWAEEETARWAEIGIVSECYQLFVSGLHSSQHRSLHWAFKSLLTDGTNV